MEGTEVRITKQAEKDLKRVPGHVAGKLDIWVEDVEKKGIREVRKVPGYHDEPLKGNRKGQRSIRLSKAYRAIYIMRSSSEIEFVSLEEVNKHEY